MARYHEFERQTAAVPSLDTDAFTAAVEPHIPALTRLARRLAPQHPPEDIVQEALVRAWRHRRRYDAAKGPFLNWLLAIAANEARRRASSSRSLARADATATGASVDDRIDVEAAVRTLPPRQRLAVDCYYFVGLSIAQTAAVMSCSEGTVKSTLSDARANLRSELEVPE